MNPVYELGVMLAQGGYHPDPEGLALLAIGAVLIAVIALIWFLVLVQQLIQLNRVARRDKARSSGSSPGTPVGPPVGEPAIAPDAPYIFSDDLTAQRGRYVRLTPAE